MILTNRLDIRINRNSIEHYKNLGYVFNMWDYINIPIEHIISGSKCLIDVKCDICNVDKKMKYKTYYNITKCLTNKYYCQKCKGIKTKQTNLNKFGFENVFQNEEIKNKIKTTNKEKYGVENPMFNDSILNKRKTLFVEKYGVENPFQNEEIKEKIKNTCLKKYGSENPNQNKDIKNKSKKTCLKKYGVEYSLQSEKIREKIKNTRINNNNQIPDCDLSDFKKYTKIVRNSTDKLRKQLFNNWDGFDYYDNEYIKDNFLLNEYNKGYPTIDHKNSIFYGFNNNISSDKISEMSNLCITKRFINTSKNKKTEIEYELSKNIQ